MALRLASRTTRLSANPVIEAASTAALEAREMESGSHFRRDHFVVPAEGFGHEPLRVVDAAGSARPFSQRDLEQLPTASLRVVLQCAGHRRSEFVPVAAGVQWGTGGVSEAVWTGIRLADLLELVRLERARYVVLEGSDSGPVASGTVVSFARSLPLHKALDENTLIATEMNGAPIPVAHGGPLRAIVPGWYATDSVKWLRTISVRPDEFEGYFEAIDYRVPDGLGTTRRLTTLAVNSLVTSIAGGETIGRGDVDLRGFAWSGEGAIAAVEVSVDDGRWEPAELEEQAGMFARSFWTFRWLADPGVHTVRVRATDSSGARQPDEPSWNPRGFANSSAQRLEIRVT